jgi:hypothetical protein
LALLRRGAARVGEWEAERAGPVPLGLDLAGVRRHADELVARLERAASGGDAVGLRVLPGDLRLRLRG